MSHSPTILNNPIENEPAVAERGDYYAFLWSRIKELCRGAVLLRGPVEFDPVQASGSGDLDILIPNDLARVRAFLLEQGFQRVFKPQAYLERYRLRVRELLKSYTIDLYKSELWGLGFRLARNGRVPADSRRACLLHAIVDGKGTDYFESRHSGPPWGQENTGRPRFGPLGRALWRAHRTGLLTLYLLAKGVLRPDVGIILRTLCARVAHRLLQLTRKTGLEVALLGVDGTGKSSLAKALLCLPAPVRVIYMGPHDYQTRLARFAMEHRVGTLARQLAFRFDLLVRRLYGWFLAHRGWIVIYDRHPAERVDPRDSSLRNKIKNLIDLLYAWPVDLTFWLTGDYPTLHLRKREYSVADLGRIDQRFQSVLRHYAIPFERIDVTRNDLASVANLIGERTLTEYQKRISVDRLPGIFRAIVA